MERVDLSLGSNMLDREKNFLDCVSLLHQQVGVVCRCSQIYDMDSWGFHSDSFLNQVVVLETELAPEALLSKTQAIEKQMGRTEKTCKNQAGKPIYQNRIIDIDILLYGERKIATDSLVIPHPLISQRAFVLIPLVEIFGNQVVAPFKDSFLTMLKKINSQS